jgi:hypothetical protein
MSQPTYFGLEYGEDAPTIPEQLTKMGFWFDPEIAEGFENSMISLRHLVANKVISTNVYNRSLSKVFDQVKDHVYYIHKDSIQ